PAIRAAPGVVVDRVLVTATDAPHAAQVFTHLGTRPHAVNSNRRDKIVPFRINCGLSPAPVTGECVAGRRVWSMQRQVRRMAGMRVLTAVRRWPERNPHNAARLRDRCCGVEMTMILAAVFGVVIGLTLAGLGAGASILAVPALVYGVGQPLDTAIPTSLAVVAISSVGSIIPRERRRQVQWRFAFVFGAAGIPATFAGTAVGHFLPQRWLLLAFAALMVVVAIRMLRGGGEDTAGACRTADGRVD